jgi:hypothetical protein
MIFEDLGEQLVKNIADPIRAFRLRARSPRTLSILLSGSQ